MRTATPGTREEWTERTHDRTRLPKTLLRAIRAEGAAGTDPRDGDATARRRMSTQTADLVAELIGPAGVGTAPGRLYLVAVIRHHYGYTLGPPTPPGALTAAEAAFIRARAWELVESARQARRGPLVHREGPIR